MSLAVAAQSMKMSDSPLLKGAKAPLALGVVLLVSGRVGTGQPPEAFGFFPPLLRGNFTMPSRLRAT